MTRMLIVILARKDDLDRAMRGLLFARTTKKLNLLSDVRVLFLGPGVELLNPEADYYSTIRRLLIEVRDTSSHVSACISNVAKYRLTEKLEKELVTAEEAACPISDSVKNGYQVISF